MKSAISALLALLLLSGCSRSASLSGEIRLRMAGGETGPPPRTAVLVVRSTPEFDRAWADHVAAFQAGAAPLRAAVEKAGQASAEARKTWDRAVASGAMARASSRPQTLPGSRGWEHPLWQGVREADGRLLQAKRKLRDVCLDYGWQAEALLEAHAAERVATDQAGHFVIAGIAPGPALLYAHSRLQDRDVVWLVPLTLKGELRQMVLTEETPNGWPFRP